MRALIIESLRQAGHKCGVLDGGTVEAKVGDVIVECDLSPSGWQVEAAVDFDLGADAPGWFLARCQGWGVVPPCAQIPDDVRPFALSGVGCESVPAACMFIAETLADYVRGAAA